MIGGRLPKLPKVSGLDIIKVLSKLGYAPTKPPKGSHVTLVHKDDSTNKIVVPLHRELKRG